jgi:hypothetical protein
MGDMLDNQISGMAAIEQYKRYNDALLNNLSGLTTFFQRNGILNNSN